MGEDYVAHISGDPEQGYLELAGRSCSAGEGCLVAVTGEHPAPSPLDSLPEELRNVKVAWARSDGKKLWTREGSPLKTGLSGQSGTMVSTRSLSRKSDFPLHPARR